MEVADILHRHAPSYPYSLSREQARVLRALQVCRTAHLGGHTERCRGCGHERNAYNSCRDRHCPKCQSLAKAEWVARQKRDLLPVPYFHLVFTLPGQLVQLALQNSSLLYDMLFNTAAQALMKIAADPKHLGAEIGFLAVLHTWGQNLQAHPHVHCVVPGGGIALDGKSWVSRGDKFFLPVRVLSRLYRGLFVAALRDAYDQKELQFHGRLEELSKPKIFGRLLKKLSQIEWVVYAKRPFGGPEQVVDYLGRYTHKVAISNHRLLKQEDGKVTFRWKDYRRSKDGASNIMSTMTLAADEFIRRFLLHVLPRGFVRIRRFGILANRKSTAKLALARELLRADPPPPEEHLDWRTLYTELTGASINSCRKCSHGQMQAVAQILSFQEQLNELRLGGYQPEILLSRVLASNFLKRSQHLENELNSWQPHGSLNHAADPQGIDSS